MLPMFCYLYIKYTTRWGVNRLKTEGALPFLLCLRITVWNHIIFSDWSMHVLSIDYWYNRLPWSLNNPTRSTRSYGVSQYLMWNNYLFNIKIINQNQIDKTTKKRRIRTMATVQWNSGWPQQYYGKYCGYRLRVLYIRLVQLLTAVLDQGYCGRIS